MDGEKLGKGYQWQLGVNLGTFGNFWRHFWLSSVNVGDIGIYKVETRTYLLKRKKFLTTKNYPIYIVNSSKLRNPALSE